MERGFILLLTFIFMVTLSVMLAGIIFLVTHEGRDMQAQTDDWKLLNLAEAGVQKALRVIRDDVLTTTQTGTADLRGANTTGSVSVTNANNMRYINEGLNAVINANPDIAQLYDFDANYPDTRIISIQLAMRANRASSGSGATIQVFYTTNNTFPQPGNTILTQPLTTTMTDYYANITADRTWAWPTILDTTNFKLRAARTAGTSNVNLDALYLRVTYEIDTNTEGWATGSYATFPISLGSGTIQSISIVGEQAKVHLNTASQSLLNYLMQERGVASATANTLATNIVNYRATNPFDSVEELQQVSAMTLTIYNLIKDYVTLYSYINPYARQPTAAPAGRAPANINLASQEVLEAIFDPLSLGAADPASLAADIITARNAAPFTCFYSSNAALTTDFYDLVTTRSYLTTVEQDRVLGNADASTLVPRSGGTQRNAVTTEFSYDTNTFKVEAAAQVNSRNFRIKTILGDDGAHTFMTFTGDTSSVGWRKENFE